jgi:hypothetical protein
MQIGRKRSTSQISCSIVFSQMPPNMCCLPVRCCTDPFGAAYSNVQVYSDEKHFVGSRVYIPTCLLVALDKDGGSLQLCFTLCTRKVEDLCIWISIVIFDTIAMITIFYTVVLSTDPGNGTVTQEFCLSQKVGRYICLWGELFLPLFCCEL